MSLDMDFAEELYKTLKTQEERDEWAWLDDEPEVGGLTKEMRSPEGHTPIMQMLYLIEEQLQAQSKIALGAAGVKNVGDIKQHKRPFIALQYLELLSEKSEIDDLRAAFNIQ